MSGPAALTDEDYAQISFALSGISKEKFLEHIRLQTLSVFKVVQLKNVMRVLRDVAARHELGSAELPIGMRKAETINRIYAAMNSPQGVLFPTPQQQQLIDARRVRREQRREELEDQHRRMRETHRLSLEHQRLANAQHIQRVEEIRHHNLHNQYSFHNHHIYQSPQDLPLDPENFPSYVPSTDFSHHAHRTTSSAVPALDIHEQWESPLVQRQRGPFLRHVEKLNHATLSCRIPCSMQFQLTPAQLQTLPKQVVQARLYSAERKQMVAWDPEFRIVLNQTTVVPSFNRLKTSKASRAFLTVKGLTLPSEKLKASNTLQVYCNSRDFFGAVVVELDEPVGNEELVQRKVNASLRSACNFPGCSMSEELFRCARCKVAHYCGVEHQRLHWAVHIQSCKPSESTPPTSPEILPLKSADKNNNNESDDDDDILVSDSIVSLNCPISIGRVQVPAKGVNCAHLECFDLDSYLSLCGDGHSWRCPVCQNALAYEEVVVDPKMRKILESCPLSVDQVRIDREGKVEYILSEEDEDDSDLDDGNGKEMSDHPNKRIKLEAVVPDVYSPLVDTVVAPRTVVRMGSREDPICLD